MNRETHKLDASKEPLGRVASKAAILLMGKHQPSFERNKIALVQVVISNSDRLILTGKKELSKMYRRHSGYIGNLKEFNAEWMRGKDSREMLRLAISGMLPKNKLRNQILKNLTIYKGTH